MDYAWTHNTLVALEDSCDPSSADSDYRIKVHLNYTDYVKPATDHQLYAIAYPTARILEIFEL